MAGTDRFGADEAPADALWMRVVRSPHARARFTLGDLEAVKARTPGLVAILTAKDVPGENCLRHFPAYEGPAGAGARASCAFAARRCWRWSARAPRSKRISDAELPIAWHAENAVCRRRGRAGAGAPAIHATSPDNVLTRGNLEMRRCRGRARRAAATAEGRFETAFVEHAYIEPEAGYAVPVGDADPTASR